MTTIAWDGKTLAVDSAQSRGDIITGLKMKKLYLDVGPFKAVAISGVTQNYEPLIKWIKCGGDNPSISDHFSILCINKKGQCFGLHDGDQLYFVRRKDKCSEGSGWQIALGAMDAGATAIEAIKIASKRDVYTGGKVQSFTVGE